MFNKFQSNNRKIFEIFQKTEQNFHNYLNSMAEMVRNMCFHLYYFSSSENHPYFYLHFLAPSRGSSHMVLALLGSVNLSTYQKLQFGRNFNLYYMDELILDFYLIHTSEDG